MRTAPRLVVSGFEAPHSQGLGMGLTDRLFLLGHNDRLPLNDPYPVASMKQAIRDLGDDVGSPLLIGLLEAYFSGARDIWLVASAPMSEYEPELGDRDASYYEAYRDRLNTTYEMLKYWDIAQITVPIDAPFNSTVDFLSPLINYCVEAFTLSGDIHLGIMGTRGIIDQNLINAMVNDGRLQSLVEEGKFVSVFVGDATFHFKELPFNHISSVAVAAAAEMTSLPMDRGLTYHVLRNALSMVGKDLTQEQIQELAQAGLNPVGRDIRGRRGQPFRVVPYTDNTLAIEGSDFWSLAQMRLVSRISTEIRSMGVRVLGTIAFDLFRLEVGKYLLRLVEDGIIRGYDLNIQRDPSDRHMALVRLNVMPFIGVRELRVDVRVGPSQSLVGG